jgi:hypothetical protein
MDLNLVLRRSLRSIALAGKLSWFTIILSAGGLRKFGGTGRMNGGKYSCVKSITGFWEYVDVVSFNSVVLEDVIRSTIFGEMICIREGPLFSIASLCCPALVNESM